MAQFPSIKRGAGAVVLCLAVNGGRAAESWTQGVLSPGKADLNVRHSAITTNYNLIWWTPTVKGGGGLINVRDGGRTEYGGGYIRPLVKKPEWGDLIVGATTVDTPAARDYEVQGEYRLPFGLGIGGGVVERERAGPDLAFGKISYRGSVAPGWTVILSAQVQDSEADENLLPGGYIALYDQCMMATFGHDSEQWRTSVAYIAPDTEDAIRPGGEVLYVDNSVGNLDGPRFLFVNATLGYRGGFLSHPARLGRAMGPTGIEYGNPLGYLQPTWNRRLDVWELGGLVDFRLARLEFPNDSVNETWEALVYPLQFDDTDHPLDAVFLGGFYSQAPGAYSPGVLAGFVGRVGFVQMALSFDYAVATYTKRVVLGLIAWF